MTSQSRRGYSGPGRYRHYKGGEYEVLGLAVREESKEAGWVTEVVYRPLTPGSLLDDREEAFWTRVLDDFNAEVRGVGPECVGAVIPRFERVT